MEKENKARATSTVLYFPTIPPHRSSPTIMHLITRIGPKKTSFLVTSKPIEQRVMIYPFPGPNRETRRAAGLPKRLPGPRRGGAGTCTG